MLKMKKTVKLVGIIAIIFSLSAVIAIAERTGDSPLEELNPAGTMNAKFVVQTGLITQDLNAGLTKDELAESLLGAGVTISNIVFTGNNRAAGSFIGGTGIIGFENGIILSSGDIKNVKGPNKLNGVTTNNGLVGDSALNTLIPGYTTKDATVLEFDFVPQASEMTFNYVFGSDEYNEYANSAYNDVFGFFVNGNSAAYNVALLPGISPSTPVSINNVNGGKPLGTNAKNPSFYRNNALPGATINTELDGLTKVLTVTAIVNPGVKNHIKLAIADSGDYILDSDVFIQGGSVISLELVLTPFSAVNDVGTSHELTAKLANVAGQLINGQTITFKVISGPNTGLTGTGVTNSNGIATWSYSSTTTGTDTIVATIGSKESNQAKKTWEGTSIPPELKLTPLSAVNVVGTSHELTAKLTNVAGQPIGEQTITFKVISGPNADLTGTGVTNSNGIATWSYSSTKTGTDTIVATSGSKESNQAKKTWEGTPIPPVPELPTMVLIGIGMIGLFFISRKI